MENWNRTGVFARWPRLAQQHDAAEFLQHMLACTGGASRRLLPTWEARTLLAGVAHVQDTGGLCTPILLEPLSQLQFSVQDWHAQDAVHGLAQASPALCVQLKRFAVSPDGTVAKDFRNVDVSPDLQVTFPCFANSTGLE